MKRDTSTSIGGWIKTATLTLLLASMLPACADGATDSGDSSGGSGGNGGSTDRSASGGSGGSADQDGYGGGGTDTLDNGGAPGSAGATGGGGATGTPGTNGGGAKPATDATTGTGGTAGSPGTNGGGAKPGRGGAAGAGGTAGSPGTNGGGAKPGTGGAAGGGGAAGSGGDSKPKPQPKVSIFVAQGDMGRSIVSCDDGRTWVANQSNGDSGRCGNGTDCDHGPGAARGITYGDGYFYANFGWGAEGSVWRSRNGAQWESVLSSNRFWAGVAFGAGRLVVTSRDPQYSDNQGTSWGDAGPSGVSLWNVRHGNFLPHAEGRFIMAAEDGGSSEVVLSNDGRNWWKPDAIPQECGSGVTRQGGTAYGKGRIVMVGSSGVACRSADGGKTWSSTSFADAVGSQVVWNGQTFMVWSRGTLHRSTDGQTWTQASTVPADLEIGPVAISEDGTLVAVNAGWNKAYENQKFYRSTDGVHWQALESSSYTGSHPIQFIAFGEAAAGTSCPQR